eukprot:COSAG01_NODE_30678_length_611_cov_1.589844_1_plen_38_part_10
MMPVVAPLVFYLGHCAHVVDVTFFSLGEYRACGWRIFF